MSDAPPQLTLFDARSSSAPFSVRQSARARRMTVRVYPGGRVEITVPIGTRPEVVEAFVARHRRWIDSKVAAFSSRPNPALEPLPERIALQALGREWNVTYLPGSRSVVRPRGGDELEVRGDVQRQADTRQALRSWLVEEARSALEPWLASVATSCELSYQRLQLRRQRTRWGSCSRSGTISLNVCLLFQPPPVVRYLLVHELCHTRHMNHSSRYWKLVAEHEPDYEQLDRALTRGWQHVPGWVYTEDRP
ncbi:MAG: SprT family zinc-dependent metalloprotease [Pseudomonadota bacterium]|nr:SprT family zinc-dependent metalloprotease [Pseudomonadota bacterium]